MNKCGLRYIALGYLGWGLACQGAECWQMPQLCTATGQPGLSEQLVGFRPRFLPCGSTHTIMDECDLRYIALGNLGSELACQGAECWQLQQLCTAMGQPGL